MEPLEDGRTFKNQVCPCPLTRSSHLLPFLSLHSTTPHSGRSSPSSSPSLRKRLQLLPPIRPPPAPEPEPGTMVEKGSDSSSEKSGVSGTLSTQSLGSRNFIRNSKVGVSSVGPGQERAAAAGAENTGLPLTRVFLLQKMQSWYSVSIYLPVGLDKGMGGGL